MNTEYSENELNRENLAEFADLLRDLERMKYHNHPSEEILRAYIAHRLLESPGAGRVGATFRDEQAFQKFLSGRVPRWTRSDVSMHVLTCAPCQERVAYLRARRWGLLSSTRQQPREEQTWWRRFAWGSVGVAAVAAIIAALWLWPPPSPIEEPPEGSMIGGIMMVYRTSPGRF